MPREFAQIEWDSTTAADCRKLVKLALVEDLRDGEDFTTLAVVPSTATGKAVFAAREAGIVAGLPAGEIVLDELQADATFVPLIADGAYVKPGDVVAEMWGDARAMLTAERTILNLLGRLCGVATLTNRYVQAIAGTNAHVYDTRKTTPGWRLLEKYAVHQGGGRNHRTGLYDAILIKDNHLAIGASGGERFTPAEAVRHARQFAAQQGRDLLVEVEVDSLEQLRDVLPAVPDIVLLDNMPPPLLVEAVALRDAHNQQVQLEASGGINLGTIRAVAETGVERISSGALTHHAVGFDLGLDWVT